MFNTFPFLCARMAGEIFGANYNFDSLLLSPLVGEVSFFFLVPGGRGCPEGAGEGVAAVNEAPGIVKPAAIFEDAKVR